jgi:hypothetical protein
VLVVLVLAAVAIGAAVVARSSGSPPSVVRSAAPAPPMVRSAAPAPATPPPSLNRALQRAAQQLLVPRFRSVAPAPRLSVPGGGTCFVGPGRCSETPCVVPAQSGVIVGSAVVAASPRPLSARCPGGELAPKTLRVVGP